MKLFNINKFHLSLRQKAIIVTSIAHIIIITTLIFKTISGHHKLAEDLTKELFVNFSASYAPALEKILTLHDKEFLSSYLSELQNNPEINYIAIYDVQNNILEKQINEKFIDIFSQAFQERKDEIPEKAVIKEIGHPHGFCVLRLYPHVPL